MGREIFNPPAERRDICENEFSWKTSDLTLPRRPRFKAEAWNN